MHRTGLCRKSTGYRAGVGEWNPEWHLAAGVLGHEGCGYRARARLVLRTCSGGCRRSDQGSNTPDGPSPGYHPFSGPPQVFVPLDMTLLATTRAALRPKHTVDQLEEGGANADFGGGLALLSPVAENGPSASGRQA
jgi:hypothetical protein